MAGVSRKLTQINEIVFPFPEGWVEFVQEKKKKNFKEAKIRDSPNKHNLVTGTQAQEDCMEEKNRE